MSQHKQIIIALGLYVPGASFTRVFDTLFRSLCNDFEIHWIGIAYKGPVVATAHYTLHPNNLKGGDIYGAYGSYELAMGMKADFVLFINDVWILKNYVTTHSDTHWKTVAYVPLDGRITDPSDVKDLSFLDVVVGYHNAARVEFETAFAALAQERPDDNMPQVHHVFHGVDTLQFEIPAEAATNPVWRLPFKEKLFGHLEGWQDSIFVLNANRFNERKDIRTTLEGFAMALPMLHRKAFLCLQMSSIESFQEDMLNTWIDEFGLRNHVPLNPVSKHGYIDDNALANLYKACEIGINTSLGEGWGLISFEHAACGGGQIIPLQNGLQEIWEDNALYIDAENPIKLASNPFEMQQCSASNLARQLSDLVNDPLLLLQLCERAQMHAANPSFSWSAIAEKWKALFLGVSPENA